MGLARETQAHMGGGIIQDSFGNWKATFLEKLEIGMNNDAKLLALLSGIQLCKGMGYQNILVEFDSKLLVDWIHNKSCSPWYLWDFWEDLEEELQGVNVKTIHQFREGNQVANFLAHLRENDLMKRFVLGEAIPAKMRGIIHLDKLGVFLPSKIVKITSRLGRWFLFGLFSFRFGL